MANAKGSTRRASCSAETKGHFHTNYFPVHRSRQPKLPVASGIGSSMATAAW